jgi:hypothetical protein
MSKIDRLGHEFVEFIPEQLEDSKLYVSVQYGTVVHRCCCGCRQQVVTPLSPADWKLTFDGESITLYPSIGNWSFACRSHYWIKNGRVSWAGQWSQTQVEAGRALDRARKQEQLGEAHPKAASSGTGADVIAVPASPTRSWLVRLWRWLFR